MKVKIVETGFADRNDTGYYNYDVFIDGEKFEVECDDRSGWGDNPELDKATGMSSDELFGEWMDQDMPEEFEI